MTILIENESAQTFDFEEEALIQSVVERTLETEVCKEEVEINVLLTTAEEVKIANRTFRNLDKTTDVLSFPAIDFKSPSDFSVAKENPELYTNQETGELILGDIMISVPHVFSQAEEYGHSVKRELAFLVAHSMLHLLGYDHRSDEERTEMEHKQERILQSLGITRCNE